LVEAWDNILESERDSASPGFQGGRAVQEGPVVEGAMMFSLANLGYLITGEAGGIQK